MEIFKSLYIAIALACLEIMVAIAASCMHAFFVILHVVRIQHLNLQLHDNNLVIPVATPFAFVTVYIAAYIYI